MDVRHHSTERRQHGRADAGQESLERADHRPEVTDRGILPERRVHRGHRPEHAPRSLGGHGYLVGEEVAGEVVHEQGRAVGEPGRAPYRVPHRGWKPVQDAALPDRDLPPPGVLGRDRMPVP